MTEIQKIIIEIMNKSSERGKARLTLLDIAKKANIKQRILNKEIRALVENSLLAFWHKGSSTYYMLQRDFEIQKKIEEG